MKEDNRYVTREEFRELYYRLEVLITIVDACVDFINNAEKRIRELEKNNVFNNFEDDVENACNILGITKDDLIKVCKMKKKEDEDIFPQNEHPFWFIDSVNGDNRIYRGVWNETKHKDYMLIGNVFKTKEDAEFALERLEIVAELKAFAEPFNGYYELMENTLHYCFSYNYDKHRVEICAVCGAKTGGLTFANKSVATMALNKVGRDRIKRYYLGVTNE